MIREFCELWELCAGGVNPGRRLPRAWLLASGACLLTVLAACNSGSYPVDVFPEMHYQPSQRRLEPRRLTAPAGAVPIQGGRPRLTFEQASGLANPVAGTPEAPERGRELYRVNCATCHGSGGRGDGPLAPYYARSPAATVPPIDLAGPRVRARTDGQLYWILVHGLGNMPPYGELLTDDEVWTVVLHVRELARP